MSDLHKKNTPLIKEITDVNFINTYIPNTILVARADPEFTIIEANSEYFKLLGFTKEEVRDIYQNKGFNTLHPEDRDRAAEVLLYQVQNNANGKFSVQCRLANKVCGYKTVHFSGRIIVNEQGEGLCYFTLTDISNHLSVLKDLEEEIRFNDSIASLMENTFCEYDIETSVMRYSKGFADRLGIPHIIRDYPQSILDMGIIAEDSLERFLNRFKDCDQDRVEEELHFITLEGEDTWFQCNYRIIKSKEGKPVRIIGKMTDVTKHRMEINYLAKKANRDGLTGLYNKEATEQVIEKYLEVSKHLNSKHAFIVIDLDNFKQINDTFGHPYGDQVLKEMSADLKTLFRHDDIVGRIGGDEFIVFMKNYQNWEEVYVKVSSICSTLFKTYTQDGRAIGVSSSIGVALSPEDGLSFKCLYQYADTALYKSKLSGKNKFSFYDRE